MLDVSLDSFLDVFLFRWIIIARHCLTDADTDSSTKKTVQKARVSNKQVDDYRMLDDVVTDSKRLKQGIGSCAIINLHSGSEHPPRDETVLHPLHRNILFSANGWSLVQVFDNNVLKIFQIRVG